MREIETLVRRADPARAIEVPSAGSPEAQLILQRVTSALAGRPYPSSAVARPFPSSARRWSSGRRLRLPPCSGAEARLRPVLWPRGCAGGWRGT